MIKATLHFEDNDIVLESDGLSELSTQLKKMHYEHEGMVRKVHTFPVMPFEGAVALEKALKHLFGNSWEGPENMKLSLEIDKGVFIDVPWGEFTVPNMGDTVFETSATRKDGRLCFALDAKVVRKHQDEFNKIIEFMNKYLEDNRLYKGKAFRIKFTDGHGPILLLEPAMLDLSNAELPTFNKPTHELIEAEILTFAREPELIREIGISLKKGVLIAGGYGIGKTMLALFVASLAVESGWTFIYLDKAVDYVDGYNLAAQYEPAILFVEDFDRVSSPMRTSQMDLILNTMDGVDTKGDEVFTMMTTNNISYIHDAFLRPGRIDTIVNIGGYTGDTALALLLKKTKTILDDTHMKGFQALSASLQGFTGAIIDQIVDKAKLYALERTGSSLFLLIPSDIEKAVRSVRLDADSLSTERDFGEENKRKMFIVSLPAHSADEDVVLNMARHLQNGKKDDDQVH